LRLARFGSGIGHQNQRPSSVATDGVTNDRMMKIAAWLKENYIDAGKLGVATGEGFYRYTNDT
jgi:3-hydroxyacyl-CoA dehydrogenase